MGDDDAQDGGGLQRDLGRVCDSVSECAVRLDGDSAAGLSADLAVCGDDRRRIWRGLFRGVFRPGSALAGRFGGADGEGVWASGVRGRALGRGVSAVLGVDDPFQRSCVVGAGAQPIFKPPRCQISIALSW